MTHERERLEPKNVPTDTTSPAPDAVTEAAADASPAPASGVTAEEWISRLSALVDQESAVYSEEDTQTSVSIESDDAARLAFVRLGTAAALFHMLRLRHASVAAHSLRVALTTSAWAAAMGLEPRLREIAEITALLHDLGMIGLSDHILMKPGPLTPDEFVHVDQARHASAEILRGTTRDRDLLLAIEHVPAWFDGSRSGYRLSHRKIPLPARMTAIVEAFDSMTTDQVYRPAMSIEQATAELFGNAGTQFDPDLVEAFALFYGKAGNHIRAKVAKRWLTELDPAVADGFWEWTPLRNTGGESRIDDFFRRTVLDSMGDGVLFVDRERRIRYWNHGMESMTGVAAESVCQRFWEPGILGLRNEQGNPIEPEDCPLATALQCGMRAYRRLTLRGRHGRETPVNAQVFPVLRDDNTVLGAAMLVHDASAEISMEQNIETLKDRVTKDPMTQVANRAEFDRTLEVLVSQYRQRNTIFSLIICDIDKFKRINDTFGHQAGDEAIKSLASLLRNHSRPGDLVARYGGEEFVLLCVDCDIGTATRRAEQIRQVLARTPQLMLDGRCITASFGVTQVQPGDTAETVLRRADRALLMAKDRGRNMVVQQGSGGFQSVSAAGTASEGPEGDLVIRQVMSTTVPISLAVEKLRGFVSDHQAKIVRIEQNRVLVEISDAKSTPNRRASDRPVTFSVTIEFAEERHGASARTRLHAEIIPKKTRDRRRADLTRRAEDVLTSLRSYLMAVVEKSESEDRSVKRRVRSLWEFFRRS
ncbi:diguanylate cyclase [Thermostilla marina]